jgi:hypothetical protein
MADHHDNERIRRGLAVLVEDAPLAPDFDDLTTTHARPIETRRPTPLVVAGLAAAAVLATFVVGGIWLGQSGGSSDPGGETPVSPTVTVADTPSTLANLAAGQLPRVLIDASDWSIVYVDHSEGVNAGGEFAVSDIQFSDRSDHAELRMNSGSHADLQALIADRADDHVRIEDAPIWDTSAAVVDLGSGFTAMWESNAVEYEFVAHEIVDEEKFRSLLSSLVQTSEEEWVSSLSEDIVSDRARVVSTYLMDVPLPPNFDTESLEAGPVEHWYQVAAETISSVSCSWIDYWIDAKAAGDTEAVHRAVDAMSSSHDWQVLADMSSEGEYPNVVWEYADAMAGDGVIVAGDITTVEASYQRAFGCGS